MSTAAENRIAKWDNAKALLILLVVTGHGLFDLLEASDTYKAVYLFIYLFHMPLFMFISGLLLKHTVRTGHRLKQRVVGYLILGFLLKFLILIERLLFGFYDYKQFYMWHENSVPWYLLVLAAYLLLTHCLRNMSGRFLLLLAVIFGCLAGYDKAIGSLFSISRFFVYYPFFLIGTYWDPEKTEPASAKYLWKAASAALLVTVFLFVFYNINVLYPFIDLIKGGNSYPSLKPVIGTANVHLCGFYRLLYYCIAVLLSAAVVILLPSRSHIFTYIGAHTLPVYMFHRPIQLAVVYFRAVEYMITASDVRLQILYILSAIVITLIFSHPSLSRTETWFWRQLKEL